jgi:beta-glucosidase
MTATRSRPVAPDFLWGTAISAHQSEGNNIASDAWLCEQVEPTVYKVPSRDAGMMARAVLNGPRPP